VKGALEAGRQLLRGDMNFKTKSRMGMKIDCVGGGQAGICYAIY
jgi:hypothetical protein